MIRYWMEKPWVQYLSLFTLVAGMVYYWGFVFEFGYKFDWSVLFVTNETYGEHMGLLLFKGLQVTIEITLISSAIALSLGTAFGLMRVSTFKPAYLFSTACVEFFRNTPLLVQLFFWYFALPLALPEDIREWLFAHNFEFWSATLGLSIYTASFMAEVIRAGLQSIPRGLLEAAYSSGLTYVQVLWKIILPVAFRAIIPPLGSEFLNNMKNSSLAMVVGVSELVWTMQNVESLTFKGFEASTASSVIYLSLSLVISAVLNAVNLRLRISPDGRVSMPERILGLFLDPLALGIRVLTRPVRRHMRKRQRERRLGGASYSAGRAALNRTVALCWRGVVFALKALFVGAMGYLVYRIGVGLYDYNWEVIGNSLPLLLIWRFPHGNPNELFWGLGGLSYSVLMAVIAISVSFFIGIVVGLGRTSKNVLFRIPSLIYIEVIRGNPLIMVIFWIYFFIPILTGAYLDVFWSATLALTIFTGAYLAEIVRSGIENLPAGQFEAALSTGLGYWQTMRKIILPQALKQMIPAIVGQFIAIFKDTSLAYVIGVLELTFVAQGLDNRLMVYSFEIYTTVAFLYFVCCYTMSVYANRLERRLSPDAARLQM
ncbi:polar amino acid transport system permease protein [Desulfobaculum xiamenense]|uniref:Polar amino acid transport system permease protein n=1 Tax=Desulfobaculum xiamenense TaxID=995050 RepID=A0A846QRD3_9BACT|nr:amino acid ABC transporter permease [Desulfobaculum xiamenense]NJB69062.1 polar amino acid transport system permease protein [Desulfobaculum xiamenense]